MLEWLKRWELQCEDNKSKTTGVLKGPCSSSSDDNTTHYLTGPPRSSAMFCYFVNNYGDIYFMSVLMAKIINPHLCVQLIGTEKEQK